MRECFLFAWHIFFSQLKASLQVIKFKRRNLLLIYLSWYFITINIIMLFTSSITWYIFPYCKRYNLYNNSVSKSSNLSSKDPQWSVSPSKIICLRSNLRDFVLSKIYSSWTKWKQRERYRYLLLSLLSSNTYRVDLPNRPFKYSHVSYFIWNKFTPTHPYLIWSV